MAALDDAYRVVDQGWPVLPVTGKRPLIKGGCHAATLDKTVIVRWWRQWPRCGWAVATGEALVVVDVDIPLAVPTTVMEILDSSTGPKVRTGSGGYHTYYHPPKALRGRVRFVPGADFKAGGGFVVIPRAVHPRTGQRYEWLTPPEADLPELPGEILARVVKAPVSFPRRVALAPRTAVAALRVAEEAVAGAAPGE